MSTQAERPFTKAELAEREKELWANELEWQRQNPHPDLASFYVQLDKEVHRKKLLPLPGLDIAMWPEAVRCDIDISDSQKFNDRFIELPHETRAIGFEKWFIGAHNLFLSIIVMAYCIDKGPWLWWRPLTDYGIVALLLLPPIYFFTFRIFRNVTSGGTRYNRQAQLVHIDDGLGRVAHIPWRQVVPFVSIGVAPASLVRLCAPVAQARKLYEKVLEIGRDDVDYLRSLSESREPFGVPINMSELDHINLRRNLQRLEFLRRYMSDGIAAIQPHPELVAAGLVEKPGDYDNPRNILTGRDQETVR